MDADYLDQLVQRGVISDDVAAGLTNGEPQRQSRLDILRQGLDTARDYLTPSYFRDTPSSPQADQALADPNGMPRKIGPPSGPPTTAQIAGGLGADVAANALPGGKLSGAALAKWLAAGAPWSAAEKEIIRKMWQSGAIDMEALPDRTRNALTTKMTQMGLRLSESPNYVPTGAIAGDSEMQARVMEGLAKKKSVAEIANDLDLSYETVRKYVNDRLGVRVSRGASWNDPETIADYKDMTRRGFTMEQMAKRRGINVGTVSNQLAKLREAGHLPGYAPMGGTRTPAALKTKSQARPITPEDLEFGQDFAKTLAAFMPQYR